VLDEIESGPHIVGYSSDIPESNVGSLTLLVYSTIALGMVLVLPSLVSASRHVTVRRLWIVSHGVFGTAMLGTFFVYSSIGIVLLFGLVGIGWAVSSWIPYALLGAEAPDWTKQQHVERIAAYDDESPIDFYFVDNCNDISDQLGLIYGMHNLSICVPQIAICLGTGLMWLVSAPAGDSNCEQKSRIVWILRLGGVFAFVAMYFVIGMREPFHEDASESDKTFLLKEEIASI
jgi:solute carrier family 45, member 1/2/4